MKNAYKLALIFGAAISINLTASDSAAKPLDYVKVNNLIYDAISTQLPRIEEYITEYERLLRERTVYQKNIERQMGESISGAEFSGLVSRGHRGLERSTDYMLTPVRNINYNMKKILEASQATLGNTETLPIADPNAAFNLLNESDAKMFSSEIRRILNTMATLRTAVTAKVAEQACVLDRLTCLSQMRREVQDIYRAAETGYLRTTSVLAAHEVSERGEVAFTGTRKPFPSWLNPAGIQLGDF